MLVRVAVVMGQTAGPPPPLTAGLTASLLQSEGGLPRVVDVQQNVGQAHRYPPAGTTRNRPRMDPDSRAAGSVQLQRLLVMGMFISLMGISRTSSGMAHATLGSTLILKWYMGCMAW